MATYISVLKKPNNSKKKHRQKPETQEITLPLPNTNATKQQDQQTHNNGRTNTAKMMANNNTTKKATLAGAAKNKNKRKSKTKKDETKRQKNSLNSPTYVFPDRPKPSANKLFVWHPATQTSNTNHKVVPRGNLPTNS